MVWFAEAYSEPRETFKMERFVELLSQKVPSTEFRIRPWFVRTLSTTRELLYQNFSVFCMKLNDLDAPHQNASPHSSISTSFSPVAFTNVGIRPKNFLTFSFNPFVTLLRKFKAIPSASPTLLNLNPEYHSKNGKIFIKSAI